MSLATQPDDQSSLNEFWEAITEIVQSNNDFMTPSPADTFFENQEDNPEPQKFIYDIYLNPEAIENPHSDYLYMNQNQKLQDHQQYIESVMNKNIRVKEEENSDVTKFPQEGMAVEQQISYIQAMLERGAMAQTLQNINTAPQTPSASSEFQDDDDDEEDKEEAKLYFNMDFDESILSKTGISDDQLTQLSVRELNKALKNYPKEERQKLKQRRRLLKNRGYAQTCRTRRINTQKTLFEENQQLKELLQKTTMEKNLYKTKYENLKSLIKKAKLEREQKKGNGVNL